MLPKVSVKGNDRADRYTGGKNNPHKWYGFCGCKATSNSNHHFTELRSCVKVEVDVLGSPSFIASPYGFCGRKATSNSYHHFTELRRCVKVEVDVLRVLNSPYDLCGRKATSKSNHHFKELRSCVKVEVDVLGFPRVPNSPYTVSVDVKRNLIQMDSIPCMQRLTLQP